MRVLSIMMFRCDGDAKPIRLSLCYELGHVGFFQQSTAKELLTFTSREMVQRTQVGCGTSVEHEDHVAHCYRRESELSCVVVTEDDYPPRVAFQLVHQAFKAFEEQVGDKWASKTIVKDQSFKVPKFQVLIKEFQDPKNVDQILSLQSDVEEVKNMMKSNIDKMLTNGEKAEDLLDRTEDLRATTKIFAKRAKKLSCREKWGGCVML